MEEQSLMTRRVKHSWCCALSKIPTETQLKAARSMSGRLIQPGSMTCNMMTEPDPKEGPS